MKCNGKQKGNRVFRKATACLLAAAMVVTTVFTGNLTMTAKASAGIEITAEGYAEGACATWNPVEGADGYLVYVSKDQTEGSWVKLDEELVRNYGTSLRADALGLTAGIWYLKVEAATFNSAKEKLSTVAEQIKQVTVTSHDRSGFAWVDGTASGAYNEDGSLKSNANVIYLTEKNKNKVSLDVTTGEEQVTTAVGIQEIFRAYKAGKENKPLNVRVIGKITDPAVLTSGDLEIENAKNSAAGITIEGVGEDATICGFGFAITNTSNIEIRNLGFMLCDSGAGDNVSLVNGNDHVWVHNCDLFYGMPGAESDQKKGDGMLDCKLSNYITFSYNHFWDSGKSCLLGLEGETDENYITYHHNWFDHSDSRHPRVRFYSAHVYNNYYDGNSKYGIGATSGCSIFAENNYFRNVAKPMMISMQGVDVSGTLSGENGGMIKAFGNYMDGASSAQFTPYATEESTMDGDDVEFDAYVAGSRDEQVPATVKTKKGEKVYNNFDTKEGFYSYVVTPVSEVPAVVEAKAGRLNGGDFDWDFDDSVDDASYAVNEELKAALTAYQTRLVSVGGFLKASVKINCTVTVDTANGDDTTTVLTELNQPMTAPATPTKIPEGYVQFGYWEKDGVKWDFEDPVTGDMTLKAKWFTQKEVDAEKRGGTPIGTAKVQHSMIDDGFGSAYFEIVGNTKHENGKSGTYEGYEGTNHYIYGRERLIFDSNASVKFSTTTEQSLLVLMLEVGSGNNVIVDGQPVAAQNGIAMATLAAGDHVLTSKANNYLYGIVVVPGEKVPEEESEFEENPNNAFLNVGNDIEVGTYSTEFTVKGFTFLPSVTVETNNKNVDGVGYGARLKTGGEGSATAKSVKFTAKAGAELYMAAMSSSGSATRNVTIAKETADGTAALSGKVVINGTETDLATNGTFPLGGSALNSVKLRLTEDGTYYVWADGGLNIYALKLTYPAICTITFDSKGGSEVASVKAEVGVAMAMPEAPVKEGFAFGGWYTDAECTQIFDFATAITGKMTLYAKWNKLYTVTFETNGGSAVESRQVVEDAMVEEPSAPTKLGAIFTGWYVDEACTVKYDFATPVKADVKLYAGWLAKGMYVMLVDPDQEYIYTGSAIKPAIIVTNNGALLKEGVDYTVKYSNNVNASAESTKKPTITVTGKGNLAGSASTTFEIKAKNLSDEDVFKGDVVTTNAAKAAPVLCYNGVTLKTGKDFGCAYVEYNNAKGFFVINGRGNYTGSAMVNVTVKTKAQLKKFTVTLAKDVLTYDGTEKRIGVTVADAKTKETLKEGEQYQLVYTDDINAGSAKVTVIGMGDYSGAVTKKYTIKPAVTNPTVDKSKVKDGYAYVSTGVTIDSDLSVTAGDGAQMVPGRDYKITYSNNKKVGTAKYTISFMGNYKGTKAVSGEFTIKTAGLADAKVIVADKIDSRKKNAYVSAPIVSVNNVVLKKSEYTCEYYLDEKLTKPIEQPIQLTEEDTMIPVYVKIVGKGNYAPVGAEDYASAKYYYCTAVYTDLSKAKVTVVDEKGNKLSKAEYTGEEIEPKVIVTIGSGKNAVVVPESEYTLSYIGNVNKGKGTVMVTGTGATNYAGSKTATFSIVSRNVKNISDLFANLKK